LKPKETGIIFYFGFLKYLFRRFPILHINITNFLPYCKHSNFSARPIDSLTFRRNELNQFLNLSGTGFMRARHKQTLARLKLVLDEVETELTTEPPKTIWRPVCPVCGHKMRLVLRLAPYLIRASPDEIVKEPVFS
jgi:hypothetical protein